MAAHAASSLLTFGKCARVLAGMDESVARELLQLAWGPPLPQPQHQHLQ